MKRAVPLLMLFSLHAYDVATMLHSIAMVVTNSVMMGFIARRTKSDKLNP
jgi:hypothetical protein